MGKEPNSVTRPILLDNTVLTNFALVGIADLVIRLWPESVCATLAVLEEYGKGVTGGRVPSSVWSNLPIVVLTEEESRFAAGLSSRLGAGERSCIAIAVHRQGLFATDDLDARRSARRRDIPTTGTIGILVSCVRQGLIARDLGNTLLSQMIQHGYRSPVANLDLFLEKPVNPDPY